jgi:hypothetical protein
MRPLGRLSWGGAALAALATLACQEQLTQPGQCPELCPGGTPNAVEEVLQALPNADSTFTGYVPKAGGGALLVSSGIPTLQDTNFALIRFNPRVDTVRFRDTVRSYTVDSIKLSIGVVGRDSLMKSLRLRLFKLPGSLDTTNLTYPGVSGFFTSANLIIETPVPDTLKSGTVTVVLKQAIYLDKLALQPADGGRLMLGVAVVAPTGPTGARVGTLLSAFPPTFATYAKPVAANAGTTSIPIQPSPDFNTYVSRIEPVLDPTLLTVGGAPAARALIRFPWPVRLRDSVSLVRATLEMTPVTPVAGLPNDNGLLDARDLLVDLGSKSPTFPTFTRNVSLPANADTVIKVEVVNLVQLWQTAGGAKPPALFLAIVPEGASFTRAVFGSTRSGTAPRLRLTYLTQFPFERP